VIGIVDYGLGNVQAIANVYKRLGVAHALARSANDLADASRLVLPGVGSFDWAMARLDASGMRPALERLVREGGRPVLGICVGMQMMADSSDEGHATGLGWIPGRVKLFDDARFAGPTHLPHMGWNDVAPERADPLFVGLERDSRFYFLHSYHFDPQDPHDAIATAEYGERFTCAVRRDNVWGVQFHPEKSHQWGIQMLKNFAVVQEA
jgi:glutamine amidotransferase